MKEIEIFTEFRTTLPKNNKAAQILVRKIQNEWPNMREALSVFLKKRKYKHLFKIQFAVLLVGKSKITKMNEEFRSKNKVTDVLSFPTEDSWIEDQFPQSSFIENELGDIIICFEKVVEQAKEFHLTAREEFWHLFVHGFLHLLGFDHEKSLKEEKLMEKYENEILQVFVNYLKMK